MVPPGHDDDDVAVVDGRLGFFQISRRDHFPVLLRNVQDGPVAEEPIGRDGGQVGALLDEMDRGIHVRTGVHHRGGPPS